MNGNDNAFPTTGNGPTDGLTKRELFAAMAMQGMCSIDDARTFPSSLPCNEESRKQWREQCYLNDAKACVRYADALIAALSEEKK